MRASPVLAAAWILLCLTVVALDAPPPSVHAREVARIRRHLAGAERLMLARDVSGLAPPARAARRAAIAQLHAYRVRGDFPRNRWVLGRSPVFVDDRGVRCAMAALIEGSGAAGLVERIAATDDFAHIRDLAGDRELAAWLDAHGLTLAEAARIQPSYGFERAPVAMTDVAIEHVAGGAALVGAALGLMPGGSVVAHQARGGVGIGLGSTALATGVTAFWADRGTGSAATFDIGTGLLAIGLGAHQLATTPRSTATRRAGTWAIAPWVGRESQKGVTVAARF